MSHKTFTNSASTLCTLHSDDANHQAANLDNWQQEFNQLTPGRFLGVINEIKYPHIHLFREDTNRGLRQQCRVKDGELWLGLSADTKSCRINNQLVSHDCFLCRPGSQDFELLTPDDFSIYGLVLSQSLFDQLAEHDEAIPMDKGCHHLWLENIPPGTLLAFRQYLSLLLEPQQNRWSSHTQQAILQDAVLELFSHAQQAPTPQVNPHQRQQIMQRVNSYLTESRLKTPVTISELCANVFVSRRTLQYTFTQCCGMSPKRYIQVTRLNQVRRILLTGETSQTIGEIALDYGFFHLGQFSQDYKRLFGETPQQTRQRERYC